MTQRMKRVALTVLAVVPFSLGWLVGAIWTAIVWTGAAFRAGFRESAR